MSAIHKLETVGDLLELTKRLPHDMELKELFHNPTERETELSHKIRVSVRKIDGNLSLTFFSSSMKSNPVQDLMIG